jgi:D-alanyl-D-alanine carboxypeptidase
VSGFRFISSVFLTLFLLSCLKNNTMNKELPIKIDDTQRETNFSSILPVVLENSGLPRNISLKILENIADNPAFILDLFEILQEDPYLWVLVDKEHSLSGDYEPDDLLELVNSTYLINRNGLFLRKAAVESLEEMSIAARKEGITLVASSAYRSYNYQVQVYERNVAQMGKEAADRESARAGHSQHQLGLVIDFGSITDAFASTPPGVWLAANASRFGWSLSFPDGYEKITGYRWESWHYRYVGKELVEFIDTYFDGIQQYALRFIHEWTLINSQSDH